MFFVLKKYQAEDYNEKLAPLPRFATAGSDKTVKIWEYNEGIKLQ